jgi:hypothetical protein
MHKVSIKPADTRLDLEDGVVGWHSQINNSIVKSDVLQHNCALLFVLAFFVISSCTCFGSLVGDKSACIIKLEWQHGS